MRQVLTAAAVAVTLAGCTTTVSGSVAQRTEAAQGGVDVALLDPGNFPTKPQPPFGNAGDPAKGAGLEARRMAGNVLGPWEVDPSLVTGMGEVEDAATLNVGDEAGAGDVVAAHNFVTGFSSYRADNSGSGTGIPTRRKSLRNVVLRFASPEDAAAAATELADKGASVKSSFSDEPTVYQPVPIPRYPDAKGSSHNWDVLGHWAVKSFIAHGPYVLYQYATAQDGADAAAELIATTLDKQGPLIDQFQPTPVDQLANLPIDPGGVLARTVPRPADNPLMYGAGGVYDAHGQLHFDGDPVRSRTIFDAAQLQLVAKAFTNVYQTPDAASAKKIVDGFAGEMTDAQFGPAAAIKGLPDAKCLAHKDQTASSFYCVAVADRYAIEVSGSQEPVVHQLVSAQYLMLTSK
ncbi:hypothetical protein BKN37_12115 [Mycobacterium talmoniae]|uniref:Uncharacterized protein n=1 Tax=Mycobacterium talmoniae TaxID=1858794 RepID=A0A1S1NLD3_9MYCO|nr:hypothetical protein BKN37_12115 [Mycobacterium talmoniae]